MTHEYWYQTKTFIEPFIFPNFEGYVDKIQPTQLERDMRLL